MTKWQTSGSVKQRILAAREAIKVKDYSTARTLLQNINHPKAKEWLAKLPAETGTSQKQRMFRRVGIALLVLCGLVFGLIVLAGVLAPDATVIPTAQVLPSETPTFTLTPTTTPTATVTLTPTATALSDMTWMHRNGVMLRIEHILVAPEIGFISPNNDLILVLAIHLENHSNSSERLIASEIRLIVDGQEYAPDGNLMSAAQREFLPERDYIGGFLGQCVSGNSSESSFLAFDVPVSGSRVQLRVDNDVQDVPLRWDGNLYPQNTLLALDNLDAIMAEQVALAQVRQTEAVVATMTATVWTATPTATVTHTPTEDPIWITLTAMEREFILTENAPTPVPVLDDSQEAAMIELTLRSVTDIRLESVDIADGRANGGERGVIIAYTSTASTESELAREWGTIFGAVGSIARSENIDLDALTLVIGDILGNAIGIVVVDMDDVFAFMDNRISGEEFFNRLTITDL